MLKITNDFQLFGVLCLFLGGIFYTAGLKNRFFIALYKLIPVMVACYFLPSLLNTFHLIQIPDSHLFILVQDYLMPACLCLLLLGLNIRAVFSSGGKLLLLFFIGSVGVFIGGPLALLAVTHFRPEMLLEQGDNSLWRGMATLAGNWVGGTANQLAIKQLFHVGDDIFGVFVTVNVLLSGIWMSLLLLLAPHETQINRWLRSASIIPVTSAEQETERVADLRHLMLLLCMPLCLGGLAHAISGFLAQWCASFWPGASQYQLHLPFLWRMVILTTGSVLLSLSPARKLAVYGADKIGSVCLYLMLAIMGLKMNIAMLLQLPWFFVIGAIWLLIHIAVMLLATWYLRLPFGYMAIASQCNLGGAASAPVVASAYNKGLVPLALLIAVFGYAWANFVAWACGQWLQRIS
ncbi:MAG: hypothetical protein PWP74_1655 [Shewanella sp.]|jgi:uncharacterized membrane protein|uniref:DUF819 family protein n=1 Tax=Shewanella sp. 4t3-1-2LB TaxID=2817682 RepID=UPI001A9840B9|nr:DUF819 family protein [Shewanella sp. 4t3-1-2LB]MBO1270503.1 DUF819 family protein [Shewanella sp. 4t3-1-2LB]MDN5370347.1 hypothetical protein [Shewanella sp.]